MTGLIVFLEGTFWVAFLGAAVWLVVDRMRHAE